MIDLSQQFITTERPYREGAVEVFEQPIGSAGRSGELTRAVLDITALGVYDARIDGKAVGPEVLEPGYTYYPRMLTHRCYDVLPLLAPGDRAAGGHVLRVSLGQGWYCGRFTFDNLTAIYGDKPAVSWVLQLEYADGTTMMLTSRGAGVHAVDSPYAYAGLYDGEIYYARGARRDQSPTAEIYPPVPFDGKVPDTIEPATIRTVLQEEMPVRQVISRGESTVLDFGQNFAGVVSIDPTKMPAGSVLTVLHGEILNEDGSVYTKNLRKAKATVEYHSGDESEIYTPRFTYMGFRYVELSGAPWVEGLVRAHVVTNDMRRTGTFSCGNELVTKLYHNQIWGQRSNYISVPTDCPQRDERMGYTGDGHVFALTGAYNFDTEPFLAKFLEDIRYSQMDNSEGYIPSTVPALGKAGVGFLSMLGWGNAVTILPWMMYWQFGTERYLREQYQSMKDFVECEIRHMGDANLWQGPNLGDWLMPGKGVEWMAMHNGPVSNSFIVNDLRVLSWEARRRGLDDDANRYEQQRQQSVKAYLAAFVDGGRMRDEYQGAYVMALTHVLREDDDKALYNALFSRLVAIVRADGLDTGFFATQHLLPLLAQHGEAGLAYDLLLNEECPGWLYQIRHGATTIWERWDALRPDGTVNETKMADDNMVSFNHYAFGSVGEFFYRCILGIQPREPGYRRISIRPYVDERLGHASGSYDSRAGRIEVSWAFQDSGLISTHVVVPAPAEITLPDGSAHEVEPGEYDFTSAVR